MADLNRLPLTYVYNGFINLTGGYPVAMINVTSIAQRSFCRTVADGTQHLAGPFQASHVYSGNEYFAVDLAPLHAGV